MKSDSIEQFAPLNWYVMSPICHYSTVLETFYINHNSCRYLGICLQITWVAIFLCLFQGVKSSGKVNRIAQKAFDLCRRISVPHNDTHS